MAILNGISAAAKDKCSYLVAESFVPGRLYDVTLFETNGEGRLVKSDQYVMLACNSGGEGHSSKRTIIGVDVESGRLVYEDRVFKLYVIRELKEPITLENE